RAAALWATSCRACFLLFALRDGYTASGAMRSARSMSVSRFRTIQRLPAHPSHAAFMPTDAPAVPKGACSQPPAGAKHHRRPTCRISPEDMHHDTSFAGRLARPFVVEPQKSPAKSVTRPRPAVGRAGLLSPFGRYMQGSSDDREHLQRGRTVDQRPLAVKPA